MSLQINNQTLNKFYVKVGDEMKQIQKMVTLDSNNTIRTIYEAYQIDFAIVAITHTSGSGTFTVNVQNSNSHSLNITGTYTLTTSTGSTSTKSISANNIAYSTPFAITYSNNVTYTKLNVNVTVTENNTTHSCSKQQDFNISVDTTKSIQSITYNDNSNIASVNVYNGTNTNTFVNASYTLSGSGVSETHSNVLNVWQSANTGNITHTMNITADNYNKYTSLTVNANLDGTITKSETFNCNIDNTITIQNVYKENDNTLVVYWNKSTDKVKAVQISLTSNVSDTLRTYTAYISGSNSQTNIDISSYYTEDAHYTDLFVTATLYADNTLSTIIDTKYIGTIAVDVDKTIQIPSNYFTVDGRIIFPYQTYTEENLNGASCTISNTYDSNDITKYSNFNGVGSRTNFQMAVWIQNNGTGDYIPSTITASITISNGNIIENALSDYGGAVLFTLDTGQYITQISIHTDGYTSGEVGQSPDWSFGYQLIII